MGQPGRTNDRQRSFSLCDKLCVENEKRNAAEMIGMKMRKQYEIDRVTVNWQLFHGDERRRSTIDQELSANAIDMKTSVESSAGPESVAAADKLHAHAFLPHPVDY
jgi:hypothetical protein